MIYKKLISNSQQRIGTYQLINSNFRLINGQSIDWLSVAVYPEE